MPATMYVCYIWSGLLCTCMNVNASYTNALSHYALRPGKSVFMSLQ